MPRSFVFGAAAAAVIATSMPLMPALAQQTAASADTRAAITVLAPRIRRDTSRTTSAFPTQTISTQAVVYIDDLDLRTVAGRDEMNNRVKVAAKDACAWLDEVYPLSEPVGAGSCESDAVKTAKRQMDAAVAQYGG